LAFPKEKEQFDGCPLLPPSALLNVSGVVLTEQMAEEISVMESQLEVWKQGAGEIRIPRQGRAALGLQLGHWRSCI